MAAGNIVFFRFRCVDRERNAREPKRPESESEETRDDSGQLGNEGVGSARGRDGGRRRVDGMARGEGEPSAKRAKVEEDPLVRRKEEVVRLLEEASAKGKELVRKAEEEAERLKREAGDTLYLACADIEAANLDELLKKLPPELLEKILDENLDQNDLLALAMTCRFFRDTTRDLGKKLETNLKAKNTFSGSERAGRRRRTLWVGFSGSATPWRSCRVLCRESTGSGSRERCTRATCWTTRRSRAASRS